MSLPGSISGSSQEARQGHWLLVYDNLNLLRSVRHEREGNYGMFDRGKILRVLCLTTIILCRNVQPG